MEGCDRVRCELGREHEIKARVEGPLLICSNGAVHIMTLQERLALKCGWLTLEKLAAKVMTRV